jgi:hypothetical protein
MYAGVGYDVESRYVCFYIQEGVQFDAAFIVMQL